MTLFIKKKKTQNRCIPLIKGLPVQTEVNAMTGLNIYNVKRIMYYVHVCVR